MSTDRANPDSVDRPLQSIRFVGPSTAAVLNREGYDARAITDKRLSYRMLVDAGVNPGVAAKLRREHSLSWSFGGGDLNRRSAQIRGLGSAEAAWVAASAGDWATTSEASTDTTDDATSTSPTPWPTHGETHREPSADPFAAEAAWRTRSKPTPVDELASVDAEAAKRLAEAGITSVRQLAAIDVDEIADVLGLTERVVRACQQAAQTATESQ